MRGRGKGQQDVAGVAVRTERRELEVRSHHPGSMRSAERTLVKKVPSVGAGWVGARGAPTLAGAAAVEVEKQLFTLGAEELVTFVEGLEGLSAVTVIYLGGESDAGTDPVRRRQGRAVLLHAASGAGGRGHAAVVGARRAWGTRQGRLKGLPTARRSASSLVPAAVAVLRSCVRRPLSWVSCWKRLCTLSVSRSISAMTFLRSAAHSAAVHCDVRVVELKRRGVKQQQQSKRCHRM